MITVKNEDLFKKEAADLMYHFLIKLKAKSFELKVLRKY